VRQARVCRPGRAASATRLASAWFGAAGTLAVDSALLAGWGAAVGGRGESLEAGNARGETGGESGAWLRASSVWARSEAAEQQGESLCGLTLSEGRAWQAAQGGALRALVATR